MGRLRTSRAAAAIALVLTALAVLAIAVPAPAAQRGDEAPSGAVVQIPGSAQRSGDPVAGYRYLVEGDYVRSGIPLPLLGEQGSRDELGRSGANAGLPHFLTAIRARNGVAVAAPNCLQCHAARLDGKLLVGLPNTTWDYTVDLALAARLVDDQVKTRYGRHSPERAAYAPLRDAMRSVGPHIRAPFVGVNPAAKLTFVLGAHRDPLTLQWRDQPRFELPQPDRVVATDVPALWLLRRKHAMFYTGAGRGDFARGMMAASLLTLGDLEEIREMERGFVDLLAWIQTLRPPHWRGSIDGELAAKGRRLFEARCASCHGSEESYPNLLVGLETVRTDPLLAEEQFGVYAKAIAAFNASWFGQGVHAARLEPGRGYVAPPLDGIWATAPYLHNGSVPTLADLLDSTVRPEFWQRRAGKQAWDPVRVGIGYKRRTWAKNQKVYDTTLPGYDNGGHTFADDLSPEDRRALLEYLKTL